VNGKASIFAQESREHCI